MSGCEGAVSELLYLKHIVVRTWAIRPFSMNGSLIVMATDWNHSRCFFERWRPVGHGGYNAGLRFLHLLCKYAGLNLLYAAIGMARQTIHA